MKELFIDNFAGGGGASTGIELAIGRSVDIALTRENQVARCGNAVTPPVPAALVRANLAEYCGVGRSETA